jgi:hypothetical protein
MRDEESQGEQNLDAVLDQALATYANPNHGDTRLAAGILAAVAAEPHRIRRWPSLAIPVAAALLLLALIAQHPRVPHVSLLRRGIPHAAAGPSFARTTRKGWGTANQAVTEAANAKAPRPSEAMAFSAHTTNSSGKQLPPLREPASTRAETFPKQETFPTPEPLTPQEQALVSFAYQNPAAKTQITAEAQNHLVEPLKIAAIQIPPLDPPERGRPNEPAGRPTFRF